MKFAVSASAVIALAFQAHAFGGSDLANVDLVAGSGNGVQQPTLLGAESPTYGSASGSNGLSYPAPSGGGQCSGLSCGDCISTNYNSNPTTTPQWCHWNGSKCIQDSKCPPGSPMCLSYGDSCDALPAKNCDDCVRSGNKWMNSVSQCVTQCPMGGSCVTSADKCADPCVNYMDCNSCTSNFANPGSTTSPQRCTWQYGKCTRNGCALGASSTCYQSSSSCPAPKPTSKCSGASSCAQCTRINQNSNPTYTPNFCKWQNGSCNENCLMGSSDVCRDSSNQC